MATKTKKYLKGYPPAKRHAKKDGVGIRGFFRLNITDPDGTVVGDSGWCENVVTQTGIQLYILHLLGASAASLRPLFAAIGTGTGPGYTDTNLPGDGGAGGTRISKRTSLTYTNSGSNTARFTGTFVGTDNWLAAADTIQDIGLFAVSTSVAGTIFAGKSFATSSIATNNNVNFTYDIVATSA